MSYAHPNLNPACGYMHYIEFEAAQRVRYLPIHRQSIQLSPPLLATPRFHPRWTFQTLAASTSPRAASACVTQTIEAGARHPQGREDGQGRDEWCTVLIFLSTFTQGTQSASTTTTTPNLWASALSGALATLYPYTCARPLSRTLVDPLAAFIDSFSAKAKGDPVRGDV
ncbi:hypothetical protein B0H14DRAFT_3531830 [Mycena olivaceomarginata]|nr:hypothetical protein B0H14DRAFT_3531830 [Mycena olivaceomarginata]